LVRLFFEEKLIDYDDGTLERDKQKVPNLEVYGQPISVFRKLLAHRFGFNSR
jgi:hypothetical protein